MPKIRKQTIQPAQKRGISCPPRVDRSRAGRPKTIQIRRPVNRMIRWRFPETVWLASFTTPRLSHGGGGRVCAESHGGDQWLSALARNHRNSEYARVARSRLFDGCADWANSEGRTP